MRDVAISQTLLSAPRVAKTLVQSNCAIGMRFVYNSGDLDPA